MTLPRVPLRNLLAGRQTLGESESHYLLRVLRKKNGDRFVAFDPTQLKEGETCIIQTRPTVIIEVEELRTSTSPPLLITWIQGLAKGDKCDSIVEDATELGATRIIIAPTERSVVILEGDRAQKRLARWQKIADGAARQSGRSDAPQVEFLEWDLAISSADPAGARICLYERGTESLRSVLPNDIRTAAFAVGPEGGLTDREVEFARESGFAVASLGTRILRTETVCAAVLGAVTLFGTTPSP